MFGKVKDPVCGMKISKKKATLTSQHMAFSSVNLVTNSLRLGKAKIEPRWQRR